MGGCKECKHEKEPKRSNPCWECSTANDKFEPKVHDTSKGCITCANAESSSLDEPCRPCLEARGWPNFIKAGQSEQSISFSSAPVHLGNRDDLISAIDNAVNNLKDPDHCDCGLKEEFAHLVNDYANMMSSKDNEINNLQHTIANQGVDIGILEESNNDLSKKNKDLLTKVANFDKLESDLRILKANLLSQTERYEEEIAFLKKVIESLIKE